MSTHHYTPSASTLRPNPLARVAPVPCVRLACEPLLVQRGQLRGDFEEVNAAILQLDFRYGASRVRSTDECEVVLPAGTPRQLDAEARARYLLESFGAVELACVHDCEAPVGSEADYLIQIEPDVHTLCSFSAYALPQLRAFGWNISVDAGYPVHVVESSAPWYAQVDKAEGDDWFSLELGTEIDGERVNLLPALLELLQTSSAQSLWGLARNPRKFVAIPLGDKRYIPVPHDRIKGLLKVLLELYDGESSGAGKTAVPAQRAAALEHLGEAFAEAGTPLAWHSEEEVRKEAKGLAALANKPEPLQAPARLRATLRPYQQEGLGWLQQLRAAGVGGVLADDMGLGKTLQTIAHLTTEKDSGRADVPMLVVTPTSLVGNWQRELKKFAPFMQVTAVHGPNRQSAWPLVPASDVVITSYPILIRDIEQFVAQPFHFVVLDEAQTIKNHTSKAFLAVKRVNSRNRLCLSGTPVENNLSEMWSLFDFLMPGALGSHSAFCELFRIPIERKGDVHRAAALRARVAPYILRRMKDTVATDLPPKTEIVRPVDITGAQRELYESIRVAAHAKVRHVIREKGIAGSTIAILDALMKLRQVCCDPRMVRFASQQRQVESAKYDLFFELVERQLEHGRRILVFSQFTTMLGLIAQGLQERKLRYSLLTGDTLNREAPIHDFETGLNDVFLISLKAGGTGLNLTSADTVIHYDPWWNPAVQAQATDRAYRIGQTKPVFVYNLIVAGSVEERILRLQRHKKELASSILSPHVGNDLGLSEQVVDDLLAPLDEC